MKNRMSIARGRFIKDYLWRKIEVGTFYLTANSRFTTPPIIVCNHQNIVNLSSHVTLCVVSALSCKNLVVSSGIGVMIYSSKYEAILKILLLYLVE